jgi:hypothetical protein
MKLIEQLSEGQYQIYQDLDGCLSDFNERFEHFSGMSPDDYMEMATKQFGEKIAKQRFWNLIDEQVGMRYWRGMKWMPEGKQLWDYIKQFNPIILTAPSYNEVSVIGKKLWVQDNLGSHVPIEFRQAKEKVDFAGPNKILIDDREDTISSWKAQNGIGFLYQGETEPIIRELKKLGL